MTAADWKLALILAAVNFTHMVDFVIIMPLGQRMMTEFGITPNQFGHIVSAYGYAAAIASILASFVIDRFDRKAVLAVMYTGFTASTLYCGIANTYETMLFSRALAGIFGGLCAATIMAVIGDAFPPQLRGRATGAVMSAFAVASIAGLPIGLMIAGEYGRGAPFVTLACVSLLVLIGMLVWLPSFRGHIGTARRSPMSDFADVIAEPRHWWAFAFTMALVLGTFTVASFIGPYLIAVNGWSENHLAVIYLVAGLCTLIGMNVIGKIADRVGKRPVFLVLASACIGMSILITNLPAVPLAVAAIATAFFMLTAAGRMVPAQAMLIGVAAPSHRGAFMSLNTAVQQLATGLAPMIAGAILGDAADGIRNHFWLVGLVATASAIVSLVLSGFIHAPKRVEPTITPSSRLMLAEALSEAEPDVIASH